MRRELRPGACKEPAREAGSGLVAWWHRLRCEACRRADAVDGVIARGAAQMRSEPVPSESLARALAAAGCAAPPFTPTAGRAGLARTLALVGVGIVATSLAQSDRIAPSLFGPAQHPGATAQGIAGFWALVGLFWYLKPVAALLLETNGALLSRRTLVLLASVGGAALLWLLPILSPHLAGGAAMAVAIGMNALLALASTILGGYLIEQAQRIGASGRLGALHQAAAHVAGMAAPLLGLAAGRVAGPAVAAGLLLAFGVTAALLLPHSGPTRPARVREQVRRLSSARELWQVALLLLLVIGPSSFEALLTRQQDLHGLTAVQRLHLNWIGEAATLLSIAAYALLCRSVSLKSLLPAGILANAGGTLLYLAYAGPLGFAGAAAIEAINGLAAALIVVTLFDLAVRAVPSACPYLGYAVLMSVNNAARALSEVTMASLSLSFATVVALSAVCSVLALLVVVRLPAALIARREGEPLPASAGNGM